MSEPLREGNNIDITSINPWIILVFLKRNFFKLAIFAITFGCVGYALSFLLTKMYLSKTLLLPEQPISNNGALSSLVGGLSGINNAERIGALRTDIYPNILRSVPFALALLKQPVQDIDNKNYPSLNDFIKRSSEGTSLFEKLLGKKKITNNDKHIVPEKEILSLSNDEESSVQRVMSLVNTTIDIKSGIITIQCEMADPIVAAQVTQAASTYLLKYVEDYRTGKTVREVAFLEERVLEAKRREQSAELLLQQYRDRNRNPFLNVARIEEQRLQSDYTLAQSLYMDLVRKLEQSKIKVKEEQPIFKVLEPTTISSKTSKPRRLIIAGIFTILGGVIGIVFIFFINRK
ncbi:GNVR domain-containing protein [Dyadobacter subterraneus]|uniref:Lipopolysaccharide biosynthesis protein n=1 Tax=Dyadobacter subterraneus TaxID=2773304 RepID=A0ABR9WHP5_9BACT|nr:GNVR domain-containing protein [Dyadobacter subterraneus]MBE9465020.1 lipopolysaccharide biosynthesis protein [Dyadobacter subterraneus]